MSQPTSNEQISLTSFIRHRTVDNQGVLVHLDNGRVIVVNEVGLHVIQQLKTPQTRQTLAQSVCRAFDVDLLQAETDMDLYLAELDKEQILEYQHVPD